MLKSKLSLLLLVMVSMLFVQCRKKAIDDYYNPPGDLAPPIYQTLAAKGNFKTMLAAIDKAGYKQTLSAAGYWTLFAPHDSAFQAYFTANSISGIDALDSTACRNIVTYSLVYNAFLRDRISDFQSNSGWQENSAFKRRTANYSGWYFMVGSTRASAPASKAPNYPSQIGSQSNAKLE